ncbi:hypothetical protein BSU04_29895 [Caballeronia sordidicola]|uniref:Uncharacterized protein n=1 Tax=Caballeronia sordidicola TaxID=196367 RepID=A0A226WUL3_CABSO|nr:hypothetical protein BSU04_29895 [Caballeronia sordidicola]
MKSSIVSMLILAGAFASEAVQSQGTSQTITSPRVDVVQVA